MKKVRKPFISSWHFIKSSFDNMLHSLFQNYAQLMNNPKLRIGSASLLAALQLDQKPKLAIVPTTLTAFNLRLDSATRQISILFSNAPAKRNVLSFIHLLWHSCN